MTQLLIYLCITVIGYFVGAFLRKKGIVLKGTGVIQTVAITLLVFVMGTNIGSDESVIQSLSTIGITAFGITLFVLAGSLGSVYLMRKLLGFDQEGNFRKKNASGSPAKEQPVPDGDISEQSGLGEEAPQETAKTDHTMTICIIVSVCLGMAAGYFIMPDWYLDLTGTLIVAGLSLLLFFVGMDVGREGTIVDNFKQAGWRIIVFPFVIIAGSFAGAALSCIVLPMSLKDALCVTAGFGWYTLAPSMLMEYSARVSAMSFIHNVMRELFGILLIPFVARKIGYIETISLPGASTMDVTLPIIEKTTKSDIAVYSFISGAVLSVAVPVAVSFMMTL